MSLELKISLLSALAALASAYWAWSSSRTAKRALRLAEKDADSKEEKITPYLINSVKWFKEGRSFISFACSYTNGASVPTTLSKIDLIVYTFDLAGRGQEILVSSTRKEPNDSEFSLLPVPLNLEPRATASGWLTFELPVATLENLIIDRYEISATSWSGDRTSLESYLVMTEQHEN
jgi:hypothetical protein